jgi:hypothetical protein
MMDTTPHSMDGSPEMKDPDQLVRRLMQRAWNRDGLPEIAIGLFFFVYVCGFRGSTFTGEGLAGL